MLPVLSVRISKDGVNISLFTVIATFGTARDVATEELRIETLFPADEATEKLFKQATVQHTMPGRRPRATLLQNIVCQLGG